jgi:ABC-type transport system substrate-binding protein
LLSGKLDTQNNDLVANIDKIEVLDDHTVAVTFVQPDCSNLERLQLGWLPMHVFTDDADAYDYAALATHEFNSSPTVFSGPFVLGEWVRGDRWTQVRNDNYWRGASLKLWTARRLWLNCSRAER